MRTFITRFFFFISCIVWFSCAFANSIHYIMDTDMGYDDWSAVLYLLKQPVAIDGITVDCQGETECPQGAMNAAKLTHLAKRDVPITYGTITAPSQYHFPMAIRDFATQMRIKGFSKLKADDDRLKISAAQFIENDVVNAEKKDEKVSIISIGTATNIADAWQLAEKMHQTLQFRDGLKMIYKGGGAFGKIKNKTLTNQDIPGNISIPHLIKSNNMVAEWNIYANAPAMRILVKANLPITFIPNNASDEVRITKTIYDQLNAMKENKIARFNANAVFSLCAPNGHWKKSMKGLDFWDTLATVTALHPDIVTKKITHLPIKVITQSGDDYGATWVTSLSKNTVTVYDHVDSKAFYRLFIQGIKK